MNDTLLRFPAVRAAVGYSRSTIYSLISRGKFPTPVRLAGGGAVAWHSSDIAKWIESQRQPAVQVKGSATAAPQLEAA